MNEFCGPFSLLEDYKFEDADGLKVYPSMARSYDDIVGEANKSDQVRDKTHNIKLVKLCSI